MPHAFCRKPLVLAILVALSSPGVALAGNIVQTPSGGAVIVTDGDRTTQRFRVNATGEVYIPGLPTTDEIGTDLTCFRGGTGVTADGQLVKCAPGVGRGPQGDQGATGAQGPQGDQGATGAQGSSGAQGPQGDTGAPGPAGRTLLSGTGAPQATDGGDGDYWLDTTTQTLFGPKTEGIWPAGVPLVGPQGGTGAQGPQGQTGSRGLARLSWCARRYRASRRHGASGCIRGAGAARSTRHKRRNR